MLFESLDKLKRNAIMSSILLIALGAIIMICPNKYIGSLTLVLGYALIVIAIVMLLNLGKELLGTGKKIGKIPGLVADSLGGLSKGKMKINFELTGYEEPLDRIGVYIKYVVLSLIACILFIGGCILASVDLQPKTENGMPLISIGCIVFAVALAIYSVGKLTKKK